MSDEERKEIPKLCEELIGACRCYLHDFQENDIPVILEYGIIPPEKQRKGIANDDEYNRRFSSQIVKFHEKYLLDGNREKLKVKLGINVCREHNKHAITFKFKAFNVYTCEEALGRGLQKEIQKEIHNQFREVPWEK